MNSIRELMEIHGYKYVGTCHCGGSKTLKYLNGSFEFRWRIFKATFRVRKDGVVQKGWAPVRIAEEYLNEIHK